jgi:fatty acid kinase fatty acid binding subunit
MSGVAVVTDTTQYLPQEVIDRHGLSLVSLYVNWNGRTDRESEMPGFGDFYGFLKSGGELPSTSQPSVGDFLAVYEPLIEAGKDIVSIHLSGGISGTVRSAEQARDALVERGVEPERIVVLDSRTGCAGHGLMAVAADNAAKAGASPQAAAAAAMKLGERMTILFAVDTLEYLRRGGRIGAAQAFLGSALKIKPILSIDSEITPVERVRTQGRAIDRLVRELQEQHDDGADIYFLQHVQAPELAERIIARAREIYGSDPVFVSEIGPVIGTHTGPGLVGVTAFPSALIGEV